MSQLARRIGIPGAVAIGLGAMIGAGLFSVWAPASAIAGPWLPLALVIAGVIATLNALSTAQLAMEHPVAGGAYAYGRAEVGQRVGFAAGWMFLTGKTASAAAIAVIAGRHLWPEYAVPVAIVAVVVLAGCNMLGVRVTVWVSAAIVGVVLTAVALGLAWNWSGGDPVVPLDAAGNLAGSPQPLPFGAVSAGPLAVLQAAGLLFFAFAGYARMATLGEEAQNPRRTLPAAIVLALGITLTLYALVGGAVSNALGTTLPFSATPVADLAADPRLHIALLGAGALACLGSLMGILAGLSRTSLAMARERDLPGPLSRIASASRTPVVAEAAAALLAILGVLYLSPAPLIALSSTCVLGYYGIAHIAAIRMRARGATMWLPAVIPWVGALACALVVVTLPWAGVVAAVLWLGLGLALRELARRATPRRRETYTRAPG